MRNCFAVATTAARARITDDADVTTNRVTIDRVVDATVTDVVVVHATDHSFKSFHVHGGVTVQFHVADMTGVTEGVVRSFQTDLVNDGNFMPNRNVEGVRVVLAIRHVLDLAVALDDVVAESDYTIPLTDKQSYITALVLKDCDYDIHKVEVKMRQLYAKGTNLTKVMRPYREALNRMSEHQFTKKDLLNMLS